MARIAGAFALLVLTIASPATGSGPMRLPALVFVTRNPVPGDPGAVPGLGPHHRALAFGGRLLRREPDGRVRELIGPKALFDVSDPAVSPDGNRIALAGTPHPDSAWRLYLLGKDGKGLRAITRSDRSIDLTPLGSAASRFRRYDDLDPCWLDDTLLCFASTRYPQRAQYADLPVTNLFLLRVPAAADEPEAPRRLTSERNGAEEPVWDPRAGRVVFTRWWFNRHRPSADGLTTDPATAIARDSVNLWQAVEVLLDGSDLRLAYGALTSARGTMAYQPAILANGSLVAVYAGNLGLSPRPAGLGIQSFPRRFGQARRLAGAAVEDTAGDSYGDVRGLAAPAACAPVGLPDGRILFSYSPGGRGDFGLFVMNSDGSRLERVQDLPGTLELDAAPLIRRQPRRGVPKLAAQVGSLPALADLPAQDLEGIERRGSFRYQCLNAFAQDAVDSPVRDAPPAMPGARIRFFAVLARPGQPGGDTAVLVREAPVAPDGAIDQAGLPADVPMFEQVVDPEGRVLMSAHGPAHVAGSNAGRPGVASRCLGCHRGHTTMLRRPRVESPAWFNLSPSADVVASGTAPGFRPGAVVDRRTRGAVEQVAWVTAEPESAWVRLSWRGPVEVREARLYGLWPDRRTGTNLSVRACDLRLLRAGREVGREVVRRVLEPGGTRVALEPRIIDAMELRLIRCSGRFAGRRAAGLAEIEILGRRAPE
ncbi:MAG TPA: hypothetical protein VGK93_06040 [Candidatus Eisenbacteria bacterium]